MNDLTSKRLDSLLPDDVIKSIVSINDKSGSLDSLSFGMVETNRLRMEFENGYTVSVINGFGAYTGNNPNLYECWNWASDGVTTTLPGITDDDQPIGHQTSDEVVRYIIAVARLNSSLDKQDQKLIT